MELKLSTRNPIALNLDDFEVPDLKLRDDDASSLQAPAWIPKRPKPEPGSSGHLARPEELKPFVGSGDDSTFQSAIVLAEEAHGRLVPHATSLTLPPHVRERHVCIVGKTGSGKSRKIIDPMIRADLMDKSKTLIVLDAKGDLTGPVIEMTRRIRGKKAKIRYLSFFEPEKSVGWNPIHELDSKGITEVAHALFPPLPRGSTESPFWRNQGIKVACALMSELQKHPEKCNLHYMYELLQLADYPLAVEFDKLKMKDVTSLEVLLKDNQTAQSIHYEAQMVAEAFGDPDVGAVTSTHEFEFDELLEPMVLIMRFPEGVKRLSDLQAVFVRRLFTWATEAADRYKDHRLPSTVCCYLDEFASALGRIPEMERVLNTFRSRNFWFTVAMQQFSQLEALYPDTASVIAESFGTLIEIPPISTADSRFGSMRSGLMRCNTVTTSGDDMRIVSESVSEREVLRPLEISLPPSHPELGSMVTMFMPETSPIPLFLAPIWKYEGFEHWNRNTGGEMPSIGAPLRAERLPEKNYKFTS